MKLIVTGAGGYVGAYLIPHLLADGHEVIGHEIGWFGEAYLPKDNGHLTLKGDIRDGVEKSDAVIYLAGLTSNAACEKDPKLAHETNVQLFADFLDKVKTKHFIFLSSAAAYGSTKEPATIKTPLEPTTPYAKAKVLCELMIKRDNATILRPAGICGYSPRMRFDLTVNKMVKDAMTKRLITVNGGSQLRPHLNMKDLVDCIKRIVSERIYGTFNLGCCNQSVLDTAKLVQFIAGGDIEIKPATDDRNYSIQSSFPCNFTVANAVSDLVSRFKSGYWKDALTNKTYENQL